VSYPDTVERMAENKDTRATRCVIPLMCGPAIQLTPWLFGRTAANAVNLEHVLGDIRRTAEWGLRTALGEVELCTLRLPQCKLHF